MFTDLRSNKNGLQKGGFSFKSGKHSCLCAMPQGKNVQRLQKIFSLLSTKIVWKLQTIFQTLMKTKTVYINVNKNCLQDLFCVRDYVAVSRCFCHGDVMNVVKIWNLRLAYEYKMSYISSKWFHFAEKNRQNIDFSFCHHTVKRHSQFEIFLI